MNIWKHRYHKLLHLIEVYQHFWKDKRYFAQLKKSLQPNQPLIAISLSQHFGDIVAAEPAIAQIRALHPSAYLVWILKAPFAELVEHNPNVNLAWKEFCANHRRLLIESEVFDKVYNLQLHKNSHCQICGISVENPNKSLNPENYYDFGNLLSIQQTLGNLPLEDATPKIYISESAKQKVEKLNLPAKFVVIHTQSNEPARNWTDDNWQLLIDKISGKNNEFYVVEVGLKSSLRVSNPNFIDLCGKLSLLETAEVIRKATLYIGIDSGPAHFANAVHTPAVLLLGRWQNFKFHQPYSGNYKNAINATIIRSLSPTPAIPFEEVWAVVEQKIS